ncbi:MAG: bifunctional phosphoribosylaminoimidazolecarboxamide formyltransferase/IMP cyclohydrolase [archaeon]
MAKKLALISVYDKEGIAEFCKGLTELGYEIISSSGTAKHLQGAGIAVTEVSELTEYPHMLGGRMKTLHPKIHGGILANRNDNGHIKEMKEHGIEPIDIVVVNLYPFESVISGEHTFEDAIENIDIGGPTMIRAAAKNHENVLVVVDPSRYSRVLAELKKGKIDSGFRYELAKEAFQHTANYDVAISNYLEKEKFPAQLLGSYSKVENLRYGENPHEGAAFYAKKNPQGACFPNAEQLHGKELSYNNILDIDTAIEMAHDFTEPTAIILKHVTPCGVASATNIVDAFRNALDCDPVSAFGGVVGLNRTCCAEVANQIAEIFMEVVYAPDFEPEALEILKGKKNIRIIRLKDPGLERTREHFITSVGGGILVRENNTPTITEKDLKVVTKKKPTKEQIADMLFAYNVIKYVKSNAILLVKDKKTVGVGAGQMSRVDSSMLATKKAGELSKGAVLASDGFFPFRDGIDEVAKGGVIAIVQPGGSVRDEEVIKAADEHGIAMAFTGVRAFRH